MISFALPPSISTLLTRQFDIFNVTTEGTSCGIWILAKSCGLKIIVFSKLCIAIICLQAKDYSKISSSSIFIILLISLKRSLNSALYSLMFPPTLWITLIPLMSTCYDEICSSFWSYCLVHDPYPLFRHFSSSTYLAKSPLLIKCQFGLSTKSILQLSVHASYDTHNMLLHSLY